MIFSIEVGELNEHTKVFRRIYRLNIHNEFLFSSKHYGKNISLSIGNDSSKVLADLWVDKLVIVWIKNFEYDTLNRICHSLKGKTV